MYEPNIAVGKTEDCWCLRLTRDYSMWEICVETWEAVSVGKVKQDRSVTVCIFNRFLTVFVQL